jgi:hypothetical protein
MKYSRISRALSIPRSASNSAHERVWSNVTIPIGTNYAAAVLMCGGSGGYILQTPSRYLESRRGRPRWDKEQEHAPNPSRSFSAV